MSNLVYGHGINDADYFISPSVNGKTAMCPIYRTWTSMLSRCYSAKVQERFPTYIGCTVADEWLSFSAFREWMLKQEWEGLELDKDFRVDGNKVYSPDTCMFVSPQINSLLCNCSASRGAFPLGVCLDKGRYLSRCRAYGKKKHIGAFATPEEAHRAYLAFKSEHIVEVALKQKDVIRTLLLRKHYEYERKLFEQRAAA